MSNEEKYELITRGLQEVLGGDQIKAILDEGRTPVCYWGTAPTGRPHLGYFVPLTKIADFLTAGVTVKVLVADIHAFLDNLKAPLDLVAHRAKYYEYLIRAVFTSLSIPIDKLIFVTGSSYQLTKEYNLDNYRLCASITEHDAKKAGAEVVKQVESPLISGLLYPGLQALDEQYLGVDFQFGGVDQRKIFTFAELVLPRLGYRKRAHLMNAMVPGLAGGKMSASDPNSKIDLLETPEVVKKKINLAHCVEGNAEAGGLLSFTESVLWRIGTTRVERNQLAKSTGDASAPLQRPFTAADAPEDAILTIPRDEKYGGPIHYKEFAALKEDFNNKVVHPGDLKPAIADAIISLLEPIRKIYSEDEEFQKIAALAYPEPVVVEKKKKKEKVYHPPPPGKGKNAQPLEAPSATVEGTVEDLAAAKIE